MGNPNWKRLFKEARSLLDVEEDRHAAHCGCRDVGDTVVDGPCTGVEERVAFLKRTERLVKKAR